jgi:mRNA interferase RelE/StbE
VAGKIVKLLAKLPAKQLDLLRPILIQILVNDLKGLDVETLKGHSGLFRVRMGNYRVIFSMQKGQELRLVTIAKRDEKAYKDL